MVDNVATFEGLPIKSSSNGVTGGVEVLFFSRPGTSYPPQGGETKPPKLTVGIRDSGAIAVLFKVSAEGETFPAFRLYVGGKLYLSLSQVQVSSMSISGSGGDDGAPTATIELVGDKVTYGASSATP